MSTGPTPSGEDRVRAVYQRLLSLYPASFRERFAEDLLQAFDDRRGEARFTGTLGGFRLLGFLLRDFVTSMPMTHEPRTPSRGADGIMSDFWQDLRFSVRMLVKNPIFTIAAVTTLALGIGLNAATFSAVHGILLKPLEGVASPEELVQIYRAWPAADFGSVSIPHYQDLRDRSNDVFEDVGAWYFQPLAIAADGSSERTMGLAVSANFFQTYGVQPALGRAFIPGVEDRDPGAHRVTVLGHGYWEARFGGDPDVIGRTLSLNGEVFEIVGVAPENFPGPVSWVQPPLYTPLMMDRVLNPSSNAIEARGSNSMNAIARLREGVTIARAGQVMDAMLSVLREEYPDQYDTQRGHTLVLQNDAGIHPFLGSAQKRMSAVMMVVVGLLLLIACVNVANLFLARARDRRREMGIRISMGAGRRRIVQQLMTESLLFSVIAGAAGVGLARIAIRSLAAFQPPIDGPFVIDVSIDSTVLAFTAAVSLAAGLVFGMAPALQAAKPETVSAVKGEANAKAGGSKASSILVVAQIALSLLLLISSGLFIRSLQAANQIDTGFDDPANIVTVSVDPGLQGYDQAMGREFWDRMLTDVGGLPEVTDVGLTVSLPLGVNTSDGGVEIPGYEFGEDEPASFLFSYVTEGLIEAAGFQLREGRTFTRMDDAESQPVMVVNQRFVDHFWPGESGLGKTVLRGGREWEIVGVIETGKYRSLGEDPTEYMLFPHRTIYRSGMTIVARTNGDPQAAMRKLRAVVNAADADLAVSDLRTVEEHMGYALLPARLGGTVLGLFGLLGLTLAAVGIYGVMAYSVSRRNREIGIRLALGADRGAVLRLVLGEGFRLALIGTAIGMAAALGASRLVQGMLYSVDAVDPVSFTLVPLTLLSVAALAVYVPARSASRLDPMRTLKSD
jgi:predicted permease